MSIREDGLKVEIILQEAQCDRSPGMQGKLGSKDQGLGLVEKFDLYPKSNEKKVRGF